MKAVNRIIATIVAICFFILAYRIEGVNGVLLSIVVSGIIFLVMTVPKDDEL